MSNKLADTLIRLRSEKNLTQQELADMVGITPSQISRYEASIAKPRKTVLLKLSKALGFPLQEFSPPKLRLVIEESSPVDPPSKLRQQLLKDLALMNSHEEIQKLKSDAEARGIPFTDYALAEGERRFVDLIRQAAEAGDEDGARTYLILARLLFGTNGRLVVVEDNFSA